MEASTIQQMPVNIGKPRLPENKTHTHVWGMPIAASCRGYKLPLGLSDVAVCKGERCRMHNLRFQSSSLLRGEAVRIVKIARKCCCHRTITGK